MMKKRQTPSQEIIRKLLVYKNGELIWRERGNGSFDKQFAGKTAGHIAEFGRKVIRFNQYGLFVSHVIVWVYHNGEIPNGYDVDHIDNNKLNDKIENLRLATRSQNLYNTRIRTNNNSGVKGVCFNPDNNNWRARLRVNKTQIEVGSFETKEQAQQAIFDARQKYHGEFANNGISRVSP
jgi:hypothetical protein